ncbi:hypothetical protein L6452_09823 [Arctium lappa]|uniref:Uncharacterized protein n=1 Tax=Arctium lappa TaxID=4217 RepID=A0ACB9DL26_ARCLA|nr:hypothetical protein L6452_09823 [Arctium lappa]
MKLTMVATCYVSLEVILALLTARSFGLLAEFALIIPYCTNLRRTDMVIPPPVKAQRITNYLKPYLLKMHFSNKYVSAQVIHAPTATVASAASSQEKALREAWNKAQQSTRDVAAAAKIGKLLGERLLLKDIPAVSVVYKREQRYHGKVRAVIDSLREAGVKLL